MVEPSKQRRRLTYGIAAVGLLSLFAVAIALQPDSLTPEERRMLGTWQWGDSRQELTFYPTRRLVTVFRDGPTQVGTWAASDGFLTELDTPRTARTTLERVTRRVVRFFNKPAPVRIYPIEFLDDDRMVWGRDAGSRGVILTRLRR